jgi:hypothetical protein
LGYKYSEIFFNNCLKMCWLISWRHNQCYEMRRKYNYRKSKNIK